MEEGDEEEDEDAEEETDGIPIDISLLPVHHPLDERRVKSISA